MQKKTVTLLEPIEVGGKILTEVSIRRSTVGDEEDAMQQAVQLKRAQNAVTVEICLVSKLTRLPYDAVRSMCGQDYAALREALSGLNTGDAPNPTTLETAGTPESA